MNSPRQVLIWTIVTIAITLPLILASNSPLLQWREPLYIVAGLAGVVAMALLLLQPLLATDQMPGLSRSRGRRAHHVIGILLLLFVIVHVVGLWITSPPDVIDALLFRSATSFSAWGVIAMWGVFFTSALVVLRKKLRIAPRHWRMAHRILAAIIVAGTVVHAVLIDGTMESISKYALCALLLWVSVIAIANPGVGKNRT